MNYNVQCIPKLKVAPGVTRLRFRLRIRVRLRLAKAKARLRLAKSKAIMTMAILGIAGKVQ